MKIVVDDEGWSAVEEEVTQPAIVSGSGVFPKTRPEEAIDLGQAATEPSPPSEEANAQASLRLPTPPALPLDLVASDDDSKVA